MWHEGRSPPIADFINGIDPKADMGGAKKKDRLAVPSPKFH